MTAPALAQPPDTLPAAPTAQPRDPRRRSRVLGWVVVAFLVLGVALLGTQIGAQAPSAHDTFDPEGRGPGGTMALAEILRDQGVDVEVVRSHVTALRELDGDTTLVFPHPPALSDDAVLELVAASDNTVVISASSRMLRLLDIGEDAPGVPGAVDAGCDWPPFARIGDIVPDRLFSPADGVTGCFTDADGDAAVLVDDRDGRVVSLVHASGLFTNEYLGENGNAGLALALMGQTSRVVWYVPSYDDTDLEFTETDTLGSLTPDWVTPAIVMLLLAGLAAALWRGRRFGPLVAETLPVTVRASETMQGRARLTAHAADAAHAAAALRTGTVKRLAQRLGLSDRATASDVSDAAADQLRLARTALHNLLQGQLPETDPDLIDFARRLEELERAVDTAVHTERNTP